MSNLLKGFQILLTFLFFAGFRVEARSFDLCIHCIHLLEIGESFHPFEHLAGDKPLDVFCTNVTDFLKCIENIGCAFDPRAPTDLELTVPYVYALRDIANIVNLSDQICTNGTQLHEDYLMHSQCFRSVPKNITQVCIQESLDAYNHYKHLETEENEIRERNQLTCILSSYLIGCLGEAIQEECGDHAIEIFKEIIGILDHFKTGRCTAETLQTIRTSFLNSLNMDESRKSFYRECIV